MNILFHDQLIVFHHISIQRMIMKRAILLQIERIIWNIYIVKKFAEFSKHLFVSSIENHCLLAHLSLLLKLQAVLVVYIFASTVLLILLEVRVINNQMRLVVIIQHGDVVQGVIWWNNSLLPSLVPRSSSRVDTDIKVIVYTVSILVNKRRFPDVIHYKLSFLGKR